jgi:hypothetical protein
MAKPTRSLSLMVVAPSKFEVDNHWYKSSGMRPDTGIMLLACLVGVFI